MAKRRGHNGIFGNKFRTALKDPDQRQDAYQNYCAHLALGKSKRSWSYIRGNLMCTWETMEKYLVDEKEFDPKHKKLAMSQGYCVWEEVVDGCAKGTNKANVAALQMVMRNKFGWDKLKERGDDDGVTESRQILAEMAKAIDSGIKLAQKQSKPVIDHNE